MTKLGGGLIVDSVSPDSGGISTITFTRNHKFAGISTATLLVQDQEQELMGHIIM